MAKLIRTVLDELPLIEPPVDTVTQLISSLNDEQRERVIKAYFGIGEPKKTLERVSEELPRKAGGKAVSRSRGWQIKEDAVKRLKQFFEREGAELLKPFMTSWEKKWELLESDIKSCLGIAVSIPVEPIKQNGILKKILEQHWQACDEGRVSQRYSEWEVWQRLNKAIKLREKWQKQKWRPDSTNS